MSKNGRIWWTCQLALALLAMLAAPAIAQDNSGARPDPPGGRIRAGKAGERIHKWEKYIKQRQAHMHKRYAYAAAHATLAKTCDKLGVSGRGYLSSWARWVFLKWVWAQEFYKHHGGALSVSIRVVRKQGYATGGQMKYLERGMKEFKPVEQQFPPLFANLVTILAQRMLLAGDWAALRARGDRAAMARNRQKDQERRRAYSIAAAEIERLRHLRFFGPLQPADPDKAQVIEIQFVRQEGGGFVPIRSEVLKYRETFYIEVLFDAEPKERQRTVVLAREGRADVNIVVTKTETAEVLRSKPLWLKLPARPSDVGPVQP